MTITLIIILCLLILVAYAFDLSSKHTKIPTVIIMLIMGFSIHQGINFFEIKIPNLDLMLPVIGTIGLILIVLEAGLDLELNKNKKKVITSSFFSALIPLVFLLLIFGFAINYFTNQGVMISLLNAVPFCIISSAIAIPSVQNLSSSKKEFVVYESSMSDIFGVILFNFFLTNETIGVGSFFTFFIQILIMLVISLVASLGLSLLIKKIDHHVKFIPIMVMIILVYALAKIYHLPALLFILIFGLFLNNLDELKGFRFIKKLNPEKLNLEVREFAKLIAEVSFLVRTLFFILFGYTITSDVLLNSETLPFAFGIIAVIILARVIQLKVLKIELAPLLFVAPRGLVTIMLFISIPLSKSINFINSSLIIQVIILSAVVMMLGLMFNKTKAEKTL
ncbi:cation:proton antiporter [Flavobacterium weaverense]|uniref:Sodium/proton antiporter (CPA1 family) n=1 Tax=Flavobacterium weaverense TaxID=271156 RepID=A0A3L9ZRF2_9FLAO|nr:cation:proton antiporter [Flavobacterium weaverense]RMA72978.1 sodium/proton antiporter (CPA1 family) [Flavobacterium weaverense]